MSKVYYTDFRCRPDEGPADKLKRLIKAAGIGDIDMDGKFVAIKMHFGELGNMTFLRPNYARAVVDVVTELGGKPFLTDCNTLYPGSRKNALEHLWCAWQNGFTPLTVGCPVIIADGLKGTDDIAVPVHGGEYIKEAKIGHAVMDADVFLSLTHFKGHEMTGFGGTIKNIGMGCGSRAGKKDQHSNGKPVINEDRCRGCRRCMRECANNGLVFDEERKKMTVDYANCVGCGRCIGACNFDAIDFAQDAAVGREGAQLPHGRIHQGRGGRKAGLPHLADLRRLPHLRLSFGQRHADHPRRGHVRLVRPARTRPGLRGRLPQADSPAGQPADRRDVAPRLPRQARPLRQHQPQHRIPDLPGPRREDRPQQPGIRAGGGEIKNCPEPRSGQNCHTRLNQNVISAGSSTNEKDSSSSVRDTIVTSMTEPALSIISSLPDTV